MFNISNVKRFLLKNFTPASKRGLRFLLTTRKKRRLLTVLSLSTRVKFQNILGCMVDKEVFGNIAISKGSCPKKSIYHLEERSRER